MTQLASGAQRRALSYFMSVAGPGLVVMLADTDAGGVITAAQSGAAWGYKLLFLQAILAPILYITQELTVRLGLATGKGQAALILQHFGRFWAWFSVIALLASCVGALLSEFSGLAGVGALLGAPPALTMAVVVAGLMLIGYTHRYLSVERIAVAVGAFELVFLAVAWMAHPDWSEMARGATNIPYADPKYLYLVSANIGAVIMPWMVFFQQSSVIEKGLSVADLPAARLDTAIGAALTQIVIAAILIVAAATLGEAGKSVDIETVQQIALALTPYLGSFAGKLLFGLGISGAAIVASIVVTLTAARTLSEVLGLEHSLDSDPVDAPWFYGVYALALVLAAVVVASGVNLVSLSVAVQVLNTLLLPIVLSFLFLLALRLPEPWRLGGVYAWTSGAILAVTAVFGFVAAVIGLIG